MSQHNRVMNASRGDVSADENGSPQRHGGHRVYNPNMRTLSRITADPTRVMGGRPCIRGFSIVTTVRTIVGL